MPRVSPEVAYTNRVRVHELRHAGYSLRAIQEHMGFRSLSSVQNYLKDPPPLVSPQRFMASVMEHYADYGCGRAIQLACDDLALSPDELPLCHRLVRERLKEAGVQRTRADEKGKHRTPTGCVIFPPHSQYFR